jgi:hypothetical protein
MRGWARSKSLKERAKGWGDSGSLKLREWAMVRLLAVIASRGLYVI